MTYARVPTAIDRRLALIDRLTADPDARVSGGEISYSLEIGRNPDPRLRTMLQWMRHLAFYDGEYRHLLELLQDVHPEVAWPRSVEDFKDWIRRHSRILRAVPQDSRGRRLVLAGGLADRAPSVYLAERRAEARGKANKTKAKRKAK